MGAASRAYNTDDFRTLARRRLPRGVFDFIDRGSEDETALAESVAAFRSIKLLPRHLNDVSQRDTGCTLFGRRLAMPVAIGPTGAADILWFGGELALARAATKAGIPFTLSTSSTTPVEQVAETTGGAVWLQTYLWERRELSHAVIARAKAAGVQTLVLTVDTPVIPNREFNARNGFVNPFRVTPRITLDIMAHPRWLFGVMGRYMLNGGIPRYANYPPEMSGAITGKPSRLANAASITWEDVAKLRDLWPGILIVKGILAPDDAATAEKHGVDGVIVSTHGGRNLDSAPAAIQMLPAIRAAVSKQLAVIVDSGIRRGSDVVKAVALGADATLIGKAALYALAGAGEPGVGRLLGLLRDEIDRTLALVGCPSFAAVGPGLVLQQAGTLVGPGRDGAAFREAV
jgi:(S)-mandelate dehydrogenase